MTNEAVSTGTTEQGATVVINHRVRDGQLSVYNDWLNEIGPLSRNAPGSLDWQVIRPIAGLTATYTVVIRFDTAEHLRAWMESPVRKQLIEKVRPLLVKDDDFFIRSGLDFWFAPDGAKAKLPVRWKQFLLTWLVIYPLVLGMPHVVAPLMALLSLPSNVYLATLIVTGAVVFLMVYVVMPRVTKLCQRWLFS